MYNNYVDPNYNAAQMLEVMEQARHIVRWRHDRDWYYQLTSRFKLHAAVAAALEVCRPDDWHQLLLEHPHIASTDPTRLAYTRDERAGQADRQTVTTIGKYLARHFPALPAHIVRDIVAQYGAQDCRIITNLDDMIDYVQRGPGSCMRLPNCDPRRHPYRVYTPELGWALAVRVNGGSVDGRALVWTNPDDPDEKWFVRSYRRNDDGYSYTDEGLESWLRGKGFEHVDSWEGAYFAYVPGDPFVAPYLDGDCKKVAWEANDSIVRIDEDGEYECNHQDGTPDRPGQYTCEDCDDRVDEDEGSSVGYHGDRWVCNCCISRNYVFAYGRGGHEYYVEESETVYLNHSYYEAEYLEDNDIVELYNGDYANKDDCIYLESREVYVPYDGGVWVELPDGTCEHVDDVVLLHDGDYALKVDAWQCYESGEWYLDDEVDPVEIDGDLYHPDSNAVAEAQGQETLDL